MNRFKTTKLTHGKQRASQKWAGEVAISPPAKCILHGGGNGQQLYRQIRRVNQSSTLAEWSSTNRTSAVPVTVQDNFCSVQPMNK